MEDEPPSYPAGLLSEPSMYAQLGSGRSFCRCKPHLLKKYIIAYAKLVTEEGKEALRAQRYGVR